MKHHFQRARRARLRYSALAVLVTAFGSSCAESRDKPRGQLMVAIESNLAVTKDLDEVRVEIFRADGTALPERQIPISPSEPTPFGKTMPGTLAVVPADAGGESVRVRLSARRLDPTTGEHDTRIVREAIARIPSDRVALLRMPLNWLCVDHVASTDGDHYTSACGDRATCVAGTCQSAEQNELPDYTPAAVFGGGEPSGDGSHCIDVQACFAGTTAVAPAADCSVALPPGADPTELNVALELEPQSDGHCLDSDTGRSDGNCYVPLDSDPGEGFKLDGGRIVLPAAACTRQNVIGIAVSTACRTKDLSIPVCGPWTGWPASDGDESRGGSANVTPEAGANAGGEANGDTAMNGGAGEGGEANGGGGAVGQGGRPNAGAPNAAGRGARGGNAGGSSATGSTDPAGGSGATSGATGTDGNGATSGTTATASSGATSGTGGSGGSGGTTVTLAPLVTSASGTYWSTKGALTDSTAAANVTVDDTAVAQTWSGFGAAFNELGWSFLTSSQMQTQAMTLLFSATDGAALAWGRIPIGANDYATSRYTCDDTGADPVATTSGTNRPATDMSLASFSLTRDAQRLIPYIKAAQAVNSGLRFWASPWTPPVWMKTGYKTDNGNGGNAVKPSYYDGGSMLGDSASLTAYAQYYTKFIQGYRAQGIDIELVSPQNEPGYEQNYPSCLWDAATYTTWVAQYLGPAMQTLGVKLMLGTLSNAGDNNRTDLDISNAVLANATARSFLSVVGVQWGVLDQVNGGTTFGNLPIWATEHKAGNYPWNPTGYPAYNGAQAPNDQAYAVESWGYIRDAITKGKVTAYDAWNMVLDKTGLGIDTSRDWKQNALLVANAGTVTPTPAYYVFRHFSQYVVPGASVIGTSGGDAVAFKNPDGSLVAVMFNSGAANPSYVVAIGGKKLQFAMPQNGWATLKYTP